MWQMNLKKVFLSMSFASFQEYKLGVLEKNSHDRKTGIKMYFIKKKL